MKCPDCNGSGKYAPLVGPAEDCRMCAGLGEVVDSLDPRDWKQEPVRKFEIEEPAPIRGVFISANTTPGRQLILAQRYHARTFNWTPGEFYSHADGDIFAKASQIGPQPHGRLEVSKQLLVADFVGQGMTKYHGPNDPDYANLTRRLGRDPCYCEARYCEFQYGQVVNRFYVNTDEHGPDAIRAVELRDCTNVTLRPVYDKTSMMWYLDVT